MKPSAILDPEQLRQSMRAWTSGVTVVTAFHASEQHGMTVSSFTSIALEPPLIIVSLQTVSRTHELVAQSNIFGVTILAESQQEVSDRFAGRIPDAEDRLAGLETETLVTGAPFIKGGLAYLDCRVSQAIEVGTNTLYLAEVIAARGNGDGNPLVYHDRNYRKLSDN
jgi:flavin reductase (DIM6/NTAB) family NADH-FMN oxidoreductase RutF